MCPRAGPAHSFPPCLLHTFIKRLLCARCCWGQLGQDAPSPPAATVSWVRGVTLVIPRTRRRRKPGLTWFPNRVQAPPRNGEGGVAPGLREGGRFEPGVLGGLQVGRSWGCSAAGLGTQPGSPVGGRASREAPQRQGRARGPPGGLGLPGKDSSQTRAPEFSWDTVCSRRSCVPACTERLSLPPPQSTWAQARVCRGVEQEPEGCPLPSGHLLCSA